jgi:arabinose-5-phosphate isomerase
MREFTSKDFAKYHPGGTLGKRLYLRVNDLVQNNEAPKVTLETNIRDVIIEISEKRLGTTAVINNDKIEGIITDGDIRRMLKNNQNIENLVAKDIMSKNPKSIDVSSMAIDALDIMEAHNITQILAVDNEKYVGVVHLHDLLKEGII